VPGKAEQGNRMSFSAWELCESSTWSERFANRPYSPRNRRPTNMQLPPVCGTYRSALISGVKLAD
jgi:hypothetical protein